MYLHTNKETYLNHKRIIARIFVAFALLFVPLDLLHAQVTKGSISGSVVDASGAFVSDATLKATSQQTGSVYQTTSEKSGTFRFSLIPPGSYRVEITKTGFNSKTISSVVVQTAQDSGLGSVKLLVAGAEVDIQVSDSYTSLIETSQAQITNTFASQKLELLTGVEENQGLDNLALLVPGVNATRDTSFGNTNGVSFSANGIRGRNNDQQIDGQNNNDNSVTGPSLSVSDAELVGEYQIVTNNFGPEYGRNGGSVVNVVTKSGTNTIHGSVYGFWTNNKLETLTNVEKQYEGLTSRPRSNTEFGGFTFGAPIVKDRLFFFNGFNEQLYHETAVRLSDYLTPTPNGITQASSYKWVDSNALAALKAYGPYAFSDGNPQPIASTVSTTIYTDANNNQYPVEVAGVKRSVPTRNHQFNWLPRVDYQKGKDTVVGRYLLSRSNAFDVGDNGAGGWFYNEPALGQSAKFGWTRAFTDTIVNELSVSFSRNNVQFGGSSNNSDVSTGNLAQGVASISAGTGNLGYGTATNMPQGRIVNGWQIQDNFTYQLNKHHLKAGINWTYQRSPNVFLPYINGRFVYKDWAHYFLNQASTITVANGSPNLDFREYDTVAYAGDDWQITPNLTLNLGVTYSFYGQPANLFHDKDVKQQKSSDPLWNPALDLSITAAPHLDSDFKLFAPSVGFAWTPSLLGDAHKTVIRGGYRLAYDPPFYNIYLNMSSAAPQVFLQTLSSTAQTYGVLPANPIGTNVRNALSSYLTRGVKDPRKYSQTTVDKNFGVDHVQSWSLGVQYEFAQNLVAEARYVGNHANHLFQSSNANPYLAGLEASFPDEVPSTITLGTNGRVDGNSSVIRKRGNTGWSDYHGLQTQVRADNLFQQLTLTAAYTFSKTTDNSSDIYATDTLAFSQNPLNYKNAEHGLSDIDFPHNFTFTFAEQIPAYKKQEGLIGHTLGGWAVSGTYFIASGQNYTPTQYGFDYYGSYSGVADYTFNSSFAGSLDGLRPYVANKKVSPAKVGAYAGDAYNYFGGSALGSLSSTQLIDYNYANLTYNNTGTAEVRTVTADQVHYILNSATAQSVRNTPWGNARRNELRDYWTNTGNLSVIKYINLHEGLKAQVRANVSNVFNHPNYSSIDSTIDDAGLNGESQGFADPTVTSGGRRAIVFSAKISW